MFRPFPTGATPSAVCLQAVGSPGGRGAQISGQIRDLQSEGTQSCLTLCDPMDCTGLLCSWDSPGKDTGVDCHFLLQGIFPTQGSNPGLLHCRQTLYHLSHLMVEMKEIWGLVLKSDFTRTRLHLHQRDARVRGLGVPAPARIKARWPELRLPTGRWQCQRQAPVVTVTAPTLLPDGTFPLKHP